MTYKGFRLEPDNWWWEKLRFDELGLPASWDVVIPDKLFHFLTVFIGGWILSRWLKRGWACIIPWLVMTVPWEIILDGCFRRGFSWKDELANTVGGLIIYWWLGSKVIGQNEKLK